MNAATFEASKLYAAISSERKPRDMSFTEHKSRLAASSWKFCDFQTTYIDREVLHGPVEMMLQEFESCPAEEAETGRVVVSAVNAACPHAAIARLKKNGLQAFDQALPYFHLGVVPEEVSCLNNFPHLPGKSVLRSPRLFSFSRSQSPEDLDSKPSWQH